MRLSPVNPAEAFLGGFTAMENVLNNRQDRQMAQQDRERRIARENEQDSQQRWVHEQAREQAEKQRQADFLRGMQVQLLQAKALPEDQRKQAYAQIYAQTPPEIRRQLGQEVAAHPLLGQPGGARSIRTRLGRRKRLLIGVIWRLILEEF